MTDLKPYIVKLTGYNDNLESFLVVGAYSTEVDARFVYDSLSLAQFQNATNGFYKSVGKELLSGTEVICRD